MKVDGDKYKTLCTERDKLKTVLDAYHMMKRTPNYAAVRAKYDLVQKQIKQLFRTHA